MLKLEYTVIESSDSEQVKALKRKIISLEAQLETQKHRMSSVSGGNLLNSEAIDYYPGEQHDFVLSILEQAKERCPSDSRPRDIIESILSVNSYVGRGKEIADEVTRIFKTGTPTSEAYISALEALGFRYITSKKHPKLRYQDKYIFVLSSTPSDNLRDGKNKLAEINKCIAIKQKI